MAFYSEDIIEEVRQRNPVVDVIGSYIHLQKKGGNYFGICPFHNEKSPSFSVSPSRQAYHCFGCGKGGNVITFVMDYENCSFPEAMDILAKRAGIDLPKQEYTPQQKKDADLRTTLLSMHKDAALFYVHELRSEGGKIGRAYFNRRELTEETIRSFGLGYASQHNDALYRYLKEKGYTDEQMKESGLVTLKETGVYDKFWNRVMFPIMDVNNHVIGFGGRVMGDGEPKYLNSPETKIFEKSRNMYGLNVARRTKESYILVCEGYMDVISMHQAGFTNAVASLGTAFTEQHGTLLRRYTEEVILCYDNDGAGRKAILRAAPILKGAGLRVKVLNLTPYKDPDEFMKNLGPDAFRERIRDAVNVFLFETACMREEYDFKDPAEKAAFFNKAANRLAKEFTDPIERNAYTEAVAKQYGIEFDILKRQVSQIGNQIGLTKREEPEPQAESGLQPASALPRKKKESGNVAAEKMVLTYLSDAPQVYAAVEKWLKPSDFSDELMQETASALFEQLKTGKVDISKMMDRFLENDRHDEVSAILNSRFMADADDAERRGAFSDAVRRILLENCSRAAESCEDPMLAMELLKKKQDIQNLKLF